MICPDESTMNTQFQFWKYVMIRRQTDNFIVHNPQLPRAYLIFHPIFMDPAVSTGK